MKLQKQAAYQKKGRTYHKYVITVPPEIIEALDWKDGMELTAIQKHRKLIIESK